MTDRYKNKIKEIRGLSVICEIKRKQGLTIISTNGVYDLMHRGHIETFSKAKDLGNILVVGINSDDSVKRHKYRTGSIWNQDERALLVASLQDVDYVCIFDEDDPREFLRYIKPDIHVKSKSGYKGLEKDVVESNGGKIKLLDDIPNYSSAEILKRLVYRQ